MERIFDRIAAIPGVTHSGATMNRFTPGFAYLTLVEIENQPTPDGSGHTVQFRRVSASYFATMRIRVREGRVFERTDSLSTPAVAVSASRSPIATGRASDPIGRRMKRGTGMDDRGRRRRRRQRRRPAAAAGADALCRVDADRQRRVSDGAGAANDRRARGAGAAAARGDRERRSDARAGSDSVGRDVSRRVAGAADVPHDADARARGSSACCSARSASPASRRARSRNGCRNSASASRSAAPAPTSGGRSCSISFGSSLTGAAASAWRSPTIASRLLASHAAGDGRFDAAVVAGAVGAARRDCRGGGRESVFGGPPEGGHYAHSKTAL